MNTTTFNTVQDQLDRTVSRFVREQGGGLDREELRSAAYESLVDADSNWELDTTHSGWQSFACTRAWWRMLDHRRDEQRFGRQFHRATDDIDLDGFAAAEQPNGAEFIEGLLAELSEDARTVVGLVLDSPAEIAECLMPKRTGGTGCLRALRRFLNGHGWSWGHERVSAAFAEVREAL